MMLDEQMLDEWTNEELKHTKPLRSGDVILMKQKHASYTSNGMHQLHGHLLLIKHSWCAVSKGIYVSAQDLTANTFLDEIYLPHERYELLSRGSWRTL